MPHRCWVNGNLRGLIRLEAGCFGEGVFLFCWGTVQGVDVMGHALSVNKNNEDYKLYFLC